MKIVFDANYRDFAETHYQILKKEDDSSNNFTRNLIISVCIAGISCIPAFMFASNKWAGGLTFFIIFCLSIFFHKTPNENEISHETRKVIGNKPYRIEVELLEKGVYTKQFGNEYTFGWENLKEIKEADNKLLFVFNHNYGISVPLKAFENSAQIGQFTAFAKSRLVHQKELPK